MPSRHPPGRAFACLALALVCAAGCGGKKKGGPDAGGPALPQEPPHADGIFRYHGMIVGRELTPTHEMDPKEATTVWHHRVEWLNNRVIKSERVSPGGVVMETVLVDYKPDGTRAEHVRNAYGIEIYSDSVDRTAVVTRTWRSGEQLYDGCYWRRRAYDSFGRLETDTCLDDKSMVVTDVNGCAVVRYQYTVTNDVQTKVCLNNDMTAAYDASGVHRTTYDRDLHGLVIDESYFGLQNEPVPRLSDGCVRVTTKRDATDSAIETSCADEKGQSTFVRGGSYTTIVSKYNESGCLIENRYVDFAGKTPKKGIFGSATFTVDKSCGVLSEADRDPRGRPVRFDPTRPPTEERALGPDGLWTMRTCKGAQGAVTCLDPKKLGNRGSIVKVERDAQGRVVSQKCFQAADKPSPCEGGYPHEQRFEYGSDGRPRLESFFDEKGAPTTGLGAAQIERKYTSVGRVQTENYLDKEGAPVLSKVGVASILFQYDVQQRLSLIQLQGVDGQPKGAGSFTYGGISWPSGAAKMSLSRAGDKLANVFLGSNDKVIKRVECTDLLMPCYRR